MLSDTRKNFFEIRLLKFCDGHFSQVRFDAVTTIYKKLSGHLYPPLLFYALKKDFYATKLYRKSDRVSLSSITFLSDSKSAGIFCSKAWGDTMNILKA